MDKWWKSPVLQGPENDYGQYDYLIEEIPNDYVKWEHSKYASKCDSCGKERHLLLRSAHYFYTLDGYDCMDYDECWVCRLKSKVWSIKHRIKKKIKKRTEVIKEAWVLSHQSDAGNFIYFYRILNKIYKQAGV
jgi:hypothetical protein